MRFFGFGKKDSSDAAKATARLSGRRPASVRASFDAAQTTKDNWRHWAMADACSADAEAQAAVRDTLRRRSRYEVANNSYAKGLVQMLANDCIGTGPRLQMLSDDETLNDDIERDFRKWASESKLSQVLRLMRMARCQDGETFAVLCTNPRLSTPVKLKLDVIEADRVQGDVFTDEFGDSSVDGIKYDSYGNPVSYKVLKYHPGDERNMNSLEYMEIPWKHMLHTYVEYRPGLHRGVPELTSALPLFAQLRRYNLAALSAAEAAADFAAILYTDAPADGESDAVEPLDSIPLERNMMVTMPAGWKMGQLDSKHPTANHSEFVKVILSEIARCMCCTYGTVSGDFSGFNYASGRLDNQIYHKSILVDREKWEADVLDRMFAAWIREWSLATGRDVPEDAAHEWFWDGFLHVDPTKEASSQQTHLEDMTTTLADEYAMRGQDWQQKLRQIAREREFMKELGIIQDSGETDNKGEDAEEDDEK